MKAIFTVLALTISASSAFAELEKVPDADVARYRVATDAATSETLRCAGPRLNSEVPIGEVELKPEIRKWVSEVWVDKSAVQPAILLLHYENSATRNQINVTTDVTHKQVIKIDVVSQNFKDTVLDGDLLNPQVGKRWVSNPDSAYTCK
jgi:hypothetical protein